jgi:hypothetical protein
MGEPFHRAVFLIAMMRAATAFATALAPKIERHTGNR